MKVEHEAAADTITNAQSSESNQTLVMAPDDSSAKTIEFLRARLLAERATSKFARKQAQEMSEKVKDLHIRLETEIEHRKESEVAMGKVLSVLKAKGVVMDSVKSVGDTPPPDHVEEAKEVGVVRDSIKSVGATLPSDYVEEAKVVSGDSVPCSATVFCSRGVRHPMGKRYENSTQTLERTTELDGNSAVVEGIEGTNSTSDACGTIPAERKVRVPLMDSTEHQSCSLNQVEGADHNTNPVKHSNSDTPIFKVDMKRGQSIQQGLCITTKLKTMLQQLEEEVGALPEEQPLRTKLQGLAGHLANMLERGPEAGLKGTTALETKNGTHMKLPVQSKYAYEMDVNEARRQSGIELHGMAEGIDRRERFVKRLFSSPKAQLQQRGLVSSTGTCSAPAMEDTLLQSNVFHERQSFCDSVNGGNRDAYVGQCLLARGMMSPHVFQYGNPHSQISYPPMIHWGNISRNNNLLGLEPPYLVEVLSPQSSDALSVENNVGHTHGQHEGWSPARASSGQNAWSPARVERQSRAMLPNGYFFNDISNELLMQQERGFYSHQNIYLQGGFPPRSILHSHKERDLRTSVISATASQLKDCLPFNDAAVSAMDDRNGRLGSVIMALDAAQQHIIQGEELMGPPTPTTTGDALLKRGYPYGDCVQQQLPLEYCHDNRRSHSHAPIVQFPPSPTSEQGYAPFERPCGVHRRSSSGSTNFMMSEWDNSLQPSREVHLGNGITLYTD